MNEDFIDTKIGQEEADYEEQKAKEAKRRYELQREQAEKEAFNAELFIQQKSKESRESQESEDRLSDLKEQLTKLNGLRNNKANLKEVMEKRVDEFNEENKELIGALNETKAETEVVEDCIRTIALDQFKVTKEKSIGFGVGIRVLSNPLFDDDAALEWCVEKKLCLKVDLPAFKKIAKVQELNFVTFEEKPTATIPTKIEVEK